MDDCDWMRLPSTWLDFIIRIFWRNCVRESPECNGDDVAFKRRDWYPVTGEEKKERGFFRGRTMVHTQSIIVSWSLSWCAVNGPAKARRSFGISSPSPWYISERQYIYTRICHSMKYDKMTGEGCPSRISSCGEILDRPVLVVDVWQIPINTAALESYENNICYKNAFYSQPVMFRVTRRPGS